MKQQESKSLLKRKVGPLGITIFVLILVAIPLGAVIAWQNDGIRAEYYLWQVVRGKEPGPNMNALREMGVDVIPRIGAKLLETQGSARRDLLKLLWQIGAPASQFPESPPGEADTPEEHEKAATMAMEFAAECLDDDDPLVRSTALRVFHQWGKGRTDQVHVVYKLLDDPDKRVQTVACGTLEILTGKDISTNIDAMRDYIEKNPDLLKPEGGNEDDPEEKKERRKG